MSRYRLGLLFLAAALAAAAQRARRAQSRQRRRAQGSHLHSIDGIPEANIVGDLLMGLTAFDPAARPIPGAATRWDVSPDGKTWTFHLRPHLWSDGTPVTAHDFVFAWERLLDPKTGAFYAYNLWVIKNAHAISAHKLPPLALGVDAPDDGTLVVRLEHPAAYLPELLTDETAYPLPRHVVIAKGTGWSKAENFVGNGADVPQAWIPNDHITLVKNPRFYDAAHPHRRGELLSDTGHGSRSAPVPRGRAGHPDADTARPGRLDPREPERSAALICFIGMSYIDINEKRPPLTMSGFVRCSISPSTARSSRRRS